MEKKNQDKKEDIYRTYVNLFHDSRDENNFANSAMTA